MAPKSRSYQVSATPVTIFAHLLAIAITTLVLIWLLHFRHGLALNSFITEKILNVHTLLMVIGFILIGGEAIMAYKTVPGKRNTQKMVHLILHFLALVAIILGIYAAFKFNHESGIPNLLTLHSWLGIITISLFGLQWLFAFFAYVFPGAESSARGNLVPWHTFVGTVIFLLAVCTAEAGLLERFLFLSIGRTQETLIINFTGLLIFLFAASVSLTVLLPRLKN
ncbi:PREDICTED: probable ascorbate-specific transmembrane electron transporter 1 [Prunus mume]|uniref:Probable ascorbate-specific transmembrane electron transporter 1 n=1 Tax=Prunus mume TaxID=102107 RepID=A0ABM1LHY2_PRUMU|nr:PREDICTED: probable ascorbate-specific transmembrane electron transporter 1 [Prunus mume]